jgi:putative methionine-R-sulfoxide reductase with GAF domain/HAMP domain-containing protein
MKKFRFTIGKKIFAAFLILIIIFTFNLVISWGTIQKSGNIIMESSEVVRPSSDAMKKLKLLVTESKMYITNWVYLQSNTADKEALKDLHNFKYPALKDEIAALKKDWKDETSKALMDSVTTTFEMILEVEKTVMNKLVSFESYQDPAILFEASEAIEGEIIPKTTEVIEKIDRISLAQNELAQKSDEEIISSFNNLRFTIVTLWIVITLLGLIEAVITTRSITKPILFIKKIVTQLGKGILPEERTKKFGRDEIGEMAAAVENLVTGLKSTSEFAENIGKGNYKAVFAPLSDQDVLGNSLINMRDNLAKVAEDDKKRSWATEGLAKFGEILRKNNDNITKLTDEIISNLIKYLNANQGGLFIVDNENNSEAFLYLSACYAWDKKKYIEQKIYPGEGLTGQSWQEKDTIYITDVPNDYINITSGLGEANPKCILIVPLKVNDEVYGVIEMASFNEFKDFEREFVEKIAESIASTISSVKINERTQILLQESRELTEQMRSQEEEMRQNMEELQATQEEMERAQKDREDKENIFNRSNMLIELDDKFNVTYINQLFCEVLKFEYQDINGKPFDSIVTSKDVFSAGKEKLSSGNAWASILNVKTKNNKEVKVKASGGVVYDTSNRINKIMFILTDISGQ